MKKMLLLFVITLTALIGLITLRQPDYVYLVNEVKLVNIIDSDDSFVRAEFLTNNQKVIYSFHKNYTLPDGRGMSTLEEGKTYNLLIREKKVFRPNDEIIRVNPNETYNRYIEGGILE